jgi:dTDP-4-dehydrorhamnose reductase
MQSSSNIIGTGLSGLVGSRIVELLKNVYSFTNIDLTSGIDITREKDVKNAVEKASGEVLLHLAAYTDVDKAFEERGEKKGLCYKINVLGTRNVAQYSAENNKYLIHISTDFVFDGKNPPAGGYSETDSPNPIEWYGHTKYLAELEVKKAGGEHVIARIAFPFRSSFPNKIDLIRSIINKLENNSLPSLFSDQLITPTFIDDIAGAINAFIDKRPSGIYHIVGSSSLSPYKLAQNIAETFGHKSNRIKKGSLEQYLKTSKRPYQKNLSVSNKKAQKELGIKMSLIEEALQTIKIQMKKN